MSAILGGKRVTEAEVREVPTPCSTRTYMPVPYASIIDSLKERVTEHTPWEIDRSEYALARQGEQLFGVMHLTNKRWIDLKDTDQLRPSIGFRSSHDKSISIGIACGASVYVCDNMMFHSSGFTAIRKHTVNVFDDLDRLVTEALQGAADNFTRMNNDRLAMKQIPVYLNDGYELLGLAYGQRIITAQQFTKATKEWQTPTYEAAFGNYEVAFGGEDAWSLYNAITFGLKNGATGTVIDRYTKAHAWFSEAIRLHDEVEYIEAHGALRSPVDGGSEPPETLAEAMMPILGDEWSDF